MTLWQRYRVVLLCVVLLSIPFFFLRTTLKDPTRYDEFDRLVLPAVSFLEDKIDLPVRGAARVGATARLLVRVKPRRPAHRGERTAAQRGRAAPQRVRGEPPAEAAAAAPGGDARRGVRRGGHRARHVALLPVTRLARDHLAGPHEAPVGAAGDHRRRAGGAGVARVRQLRRRAAERRLAQRRRRDGRALRRPGHRAGRRRAGSLRREGGVPPAHRRRARGRRGGHLGARVPLPRGAPGGARGGGDAAGVRALPGGRALARGEPSRLGEVLVLATESVDRPGCRPGTAPSQRARRTETRGGS